MKKYAFILFGLLTLTIFVSSCKKDNDTSPSSNFPGVPSGEIVSVEEREGVLTRTSTSLKYTNSDGYWTYSEAKITISGCGNEEETDLFAEQGISPSSIEIKFGLDHILYTRQNGIESQAGTWSWSNESTKDGIIIDKYPSVEFTFTALNKNEVVYASKQEGAYQDCTSVTAITYERVVYY